MGRLFYVIGSMCVFAAQYCMAKCLRTMAAGMLALPFILLVRKGNRTGRADINFYAMLFLLPTALMGMNKIFFHTKLSLIFVLCYRFSQTAYGLAYFGVMGLLLLRFLRKNYRLVRQVHALPVWADAERFKQSVFPAAGSGARGWRGRYLDRIRIYTTEESVSPFSGGLLRPFVVVPRQMLEEWPEDERRAVLCHELVHLLSGHIVWSTLFQLLKIYWWANPVIYLCDRMFREDMELVCDERCIRYADVSCGTYGKALLNMIALMKGAGMEGTLCFSDKKNFLSLKKRIGNLASSGREQRETAQQGRHRVIFAILFGAALALIAATSYPKYTELDDIVLYDETLEMLDYDSEELRSAVSVSDGRLVIEQERFAELLARKNVKGEYVYVSFGCVMKVPGSGGGGNVGMVAVNDFEDIFYLAAEGPEKDIAIFWLKYLI